MEKRLTTSRTLESLSQTHTMHVSSSDVHPFHKYTSFTNAAVHNMTHMKITRSYYARQSSGLATLDHHDDDHKLVALNC